MSALTDQLSEDDLRELARIVRAAHARRAARLERERLDRERLNCPEDDPSRDAGDGDHDAA